MMYILNVDMRYVLWVFHSCLPPQMLRHHLDIKSQVANKFACNGVGPWWPDPIKAYKKIYVYIYIPYAEWLYNRLIHQHLAQHCPEPMVRMRCSVAPPCLFQEVNDTQNGLKSSLNKKRCLKNKILVMKCHKWESYSFIVMVWIVLRISWALQLHLSLPTG